MDNNQLESISVSTVNSYFSRHGYVVPHTNKQDKTPLWDGQLFIYKEKTNFSKATFRYQIPVQIKSSFHQGRKMPNATTHRVDIIDLRNYEQNGGVAYFKVLISDESETIYCAFLNRLELRRAIEAGEGHNTTSIKLKKIPSNYSDVLTELYRIHLQQHNPIMDVKDIPAKFEATLMTESEDQIYAPAYLATHPIDFVIKHKNNHFYPGTGSAILNQYVVNNPVTINGEVFFDSFEIHYEANGVHFIIDKILEIIIKPNSAANKNEDSVKGHFQLNCPPQLLSSYLHNLRFALALSKYKIISMGNYTQELSELDSNDDFFIDCKRNLDRWSKVKQTLDLLGLREDLDLENISDTELKHLDLIVKGIYDKKKIKANFKQGGLLNAKYANVYLAVVVNILEDGFCEFINIYEPSVTVSYRVNQKQRQITSIFSMLFEQEILPSNIRWDLLLESYNHFIPLNPNIFNRANFDVINLLRHFDKSPNTDYINAAISLCEWLAEKDNSNDNKDIYLLNKAQSLMRRDGVISEDIGEKLVELSQFTRNKDFEFACSVLLGETRRSRVLWSQLPDSVKNTLNTMPITTLFNRLNSNN